MKTTAWAAAVTISLCSPGMVQNALASEKLTLATDQTYTPAYTAGIGLTSLIKVELLPRYKIDLHAIISSGPNENIRLMRQGAADLAILPSTTGYAARAGIGSFAGHPPELKLRAITTLWRDAIHLIVRNEDASTGTIDDLLKLKNPKVFLGDETARMADVNHVLLTGLGLDIDKTFDVSPLPDSDIISAIKQGGLDAYSMAARPPSPMFHDITDLNAVGLKFLDITGTQMIRANGNHWLWTPYTIPAATYPGQAEEIATIAYSTLLVVNADISNETVYLITRSIFENLPYLHRIAPNLTEMTLDHVMTGMTMPLHPGALRYFKEQDLIPDTMPLKAPAHHEQPQGTSSGVTTTYDSPMIEK